MTTQAQTNLSDYLTKRIPKRETRAVWLTTLASLDWPKIYARSEESIKLQKQELIDILDKYQKGKYQYRTLAGACACSYDLSVGY